jgi:hypothetical protein
LGDESPMNHLKGISKKGNPLESLYRKYYLMMERCYNPNSINFSKYGARGITICHEWLNNNKSFFDWALKNGWEKGLQIDRINNLLGYSPENCHFVTSRENNRNRNNNLFVTVNGKTKCLSEWVTIYDVRYKTARERLIKGYSGNDVLSTSRLPRLSAEYVIYKGMKLPLSKWSIVLNINYETLRSRLYRYNWSVDRAFSESVDTKRNWRLVA